MAVRDAGARRWIDNQQLVQWSDVATPPPLGPDELHVWWLPLQQTAPRLAVLESTLSDVEQSRAARFRRDGLRANYIAGRGWLRILVGAYLDCEPVSVEFILGAYGKPGVQPRAGRRLCFNYSDADDMALYAFAWDREVGADLERLTREVSFQRIATRKFTADEADSLAQLPASQQSEAFLVGWTRKEGYGKARGVGIHYPLNEVELCVDYHRNHLTVADPDYGHWVLHQIYPDHEHTGTVVHVAGAPRLRFLRAGPDFGLGSLA